MYRIYFRDVIHIRIGPSPLDTYALRTYDTDMAPQGQWVHAIVSNKSILIPMNMVLYVECLPSQDYKDPRPKSWRKG